MKESGNTKILCALSGGVDSAVSAALLKRSGFEVSGAFMRLTGRDKESEARARQCAKILGIRFFVFDLRAEFKKKIIDRFVKETKKGLTPNPCVYCNEKIKVGLLWKKASLAGVDLMATGHYAQIKKTKDGVYHLMKAKDKNKDQSYFLWRLGQKDLGRVIFPVGCFEKEEVRAMAKKWKLPCKKEFESQEICFACGDMNGFLEKHCGMAAGNIADEKGNILGRHSGLWFYTIGQRKGIKLPGGPFYVVKKDLGSNTLIVSKRKDFGSRKVYLADERWILGCQPALPFSAKAKIRSRSPESAVRIAREGKKLVLNFTRKQLAATPGQAAVFYRKNEVLGGGIIVSA